MNHPTADELLLLAYDELPATRAGELESHVAACSSCAEEVAQLERGRAALDLAVPPRPRRAAIVWAMLGLAAAAAIVGVVITRSGRVMPPEHWQPTMTWSATAGYVTGGKAMMDIDAQLTRLEQGRNHGLPN